jgi:cytidyltransferase-like protein
MKKVFVSGCFDLLHSGHIAFFEEASSHGDLYVGVGSDTTIIGLKGRKPVNSDQERLYMVRALKTVKEAWINQGSGLLDFEMELRKLSPEIFFVNEEGFTPDKQKLCQELGIELMVSKRIPHTGLPVRSTTAHRKECRIPFRLDLAGGWLDQPYVSKFSAGPVITISIEPDIDFNDRSGMSSSTRFKAIELWQTEIPGGDKEKLARTLFCYENPPGTKMFSGSQDSIGIVYPGVNKLDYQKECYWPSSITSITAEDTLTWIEEHLWFINLSPRKANFDVLAGTKIDEQGATALANASNGLWNSILSKDLGAFSKYFRASFEAQIAMFPNMVSSFINETIKNYEHEALGWKISGAGGGGYLVLVSEKPIANATQIKIRR